MWAGIEGENGGSIGRAGVTGPNADWVRAQRGLEGEGTGGGGNQGLPPGRWGKGLSKKYRCGAEKGKGGGGELTGGGVG